MKVADVMVEDLQVVSQESPIADAVLVLTEEHISGLPVVDATGQLMGVISSTDILQAVAENEDADSRDRLFKSTRVSELMTSRPETVKSDCDLRVAAERMLALEVHRLFVVDDGKVIGVLSQTDVVRAVARADL